MPIKMNPLVFVPQWGEEVPVQSIIAAKRHGSEDDGLPRRYAQSCYNKACMLPQHTFIPPPGWGTQEPSRCRFIPKTPDYYSPIPLTCPEHGPDCRPASAVITGMETAVACWVYNKKCTSLDQVPQEHFGGIPEHLLDVELRIFKVRVARDEDGDKCYAYLTHTNTLREYIRRKAASNGPRSNHRSGIIDTETSDNGSNSCPPTPGPGDNSSYSGDDRSGLDVVDSDVGHKSAPNCLASGLDNDHSHVDSHSGYSDSDVIGLDDENSGLSATDSLMQSSSPRLSGGLSDSDNNDSDLPYSTPCRGNGHSYADTRVQDPETDGSYLEDGRSDETSDPSNTDDTMSSPGGGGPAPGRIVPDSEDDASGIRGQSILTDDETTAPGHASNKTRTSTPRETGCTDQYASDADIAERISRADKPRQSGSKKLKLVLHRIQQRCLQEWLRSPAAAEFFKLSSTTDARASEDAPMCILCAGQYHRCLSEDKRRPATQLMVQDVRGRSIMTMITHLTAHDQEWDIRATAMHEMVQNIPWLCESQVH